MILCVVVLLGVATAVAQVNTATLAGMVTDPQGLTVRGAKVTATSLATGAERTATADEGGHYSIVGLVPGEYKIRVEGGTNFAPYENPSVQVTVGQEAVLNVRLELGTQTQIVTVSSESLPIETTRSESAQTVEERQIDNLPINGRNYINFTLTNSQTTRDVSPTIGPAPNSGLNLSGARARSNMVSVDGADAGDNSVNGIRATVSQEAVQEFQMILSNYNAEYGRATGGVVNIVTKSGSNDFHGDVFGYFRNKAFQSRNAFSGEIDASGNLVPVKQAYTRTQSGLTLGGALKKDKTFYFFSYEYTQREETGFSSIGMGNYGLESVNLPVPGVPGGVLPVQLTASQASAVNSLLTSGVPALQALGVNYGVLMGSASSVATNRLDYGVLAAGLTGGASEPGSWPAIPGSGGLSSESNSQSCDLRSFGEGIAPSARILRGSQQHPREFSCDGKNQLVVRASRSALEQSQHIVPPRWRFSFAGHRHSVHLAEPGLRPKCRLAHWRQSIPRLQRDFPARYHPE